MMIRALAPRIGRRLSFGVVPNWHGRWPLAEYPDYCELLCESADELLLHGYFHRRQRGYGPATLLTASSDEMNGLDPEETCRTLERGQRALIDAFGAPARGFVAPAWQRARVRPGDDLQHVLGFFSLESAAGRRVPLATCTWDCGRWSWLGHVGHGVGWLLRSRDGRVPTLAIHPRDLERGFWPQILRAVEKLLESGYQPTTPAALLEVTC